jgi:hypothetical protein
VWTNEWILAKSRRRALFCCHRVCRSWPRIKTTGFNYCKIYGSCFIKLTLIELSLYFEVEFSRQRLRSQPRSFTLGSWSWFWIHWNQRINFSRR